MAPLLPRESEKMSESICLSERDTFEWNCCPRGYERFHRAMAHEPCSLLSKNPKREGF